MAPDRSSVLTSALAGDRRLPGFTESPFVAAEVEGLVGPATRIDVTVRPFPKRYELRFDRAASYRLQKCIDGAFSAAAIAAGGRPLRLASGLGAAVIDLTESARPAFAGRFADATFYAGSLLKLAPMYAAFELRLRVQRAVDGARAQGLDVTRAGWERPVLQALAAAWARPIAAGLRPGRFPDLTQIFAFESGGRVSFRSGGLTAPEVRTVAEHPDKRAPDFNAREAVRRKLAARTRFAEWMTLMVRYSDNGFAGQVITALGYPYLNGVLREAGFFDPRTRSGMWVSGNYAGRDWKPGADLMPLSAPGAEHYKATTNFAASADAVACLLALLGRRALFGGTTPGKAACDEMLALLKSDGALDTIARVVEQALAGSGLAAVYSKIGIGDPAPGKRPGLHDCAIVERMRGATRLRYVVVGLGGFTRQADAMKRLFIELDKCVVAARAGSAAGAGAAASATEVPLVDGERPHRVQHEVARGGRVARTLLLMLDGVAVGWPLSAGGGRRREGASPEFEPIALECDAGMTPPFYDWLAQGLEARVLRKDGVLVRTDDHGNELARLDFSNALVTKIAFPALDVDSKERGRIWVRLQPERTELSRGSGAKVRGPRLSRIASPWLCSKFRLRIAGLDTGGLSRVEPLVFLQKVKSFGQRIPDIVPNSLALPALVVTLRGTSAATWTAWYEEQLVGGPSARNGLLEYRARNGTVLFELALGGLQLASLSVDKPGARDGRLHATLYPGWVALRAPAKRSRSQPAAPSPAAG